MPKKPKKADIACEFKCWQGRKILLYRSTLKNHILRLHLESAFVVDALKRDFHAPICVIKNMHHGTLNAIYKIETDGQPFLLVAIHIQKKMKRMVGKPHFIKSFYGVSVIPKGQVVWGKLP